MPVGPLPLLAVPLLLAVAALAFTRPGTRPGALPRLDEAAALAAFGLAAAGVVQVVISGPLVLTRGSGLATITFRLDTVEPSDTAGLDIAKGERHAIIGPNGAGKSTLFNLISGLYVPTSGTVSLNGTLISGVPPHEINRMGLSRSFQVSNIFANMTVRENVRCGVLHSLGQGYSFWKNIGTQKDVNAKTFEVMEHCGLLDKANTPAALLPYADQRSLEIAITIAGGADVILLDEPTAGMSHSEPDRAVVVVERRGDGGGIGQSGSAEVAEPHPVGRGQLDTAQL